MNIDEYVREQNEGSHWTTKKPGYQKLLKESIAYAAGMLCDTLARVLDVGCGDGWSIEEWGRWGHQTVGIDLCEAKVADARSRGLPVSRVILGVEALPFTDGFFDAVFCSHTLEHIPGEWLEKAVREIARVVRDGGKGLFIVPYGKKAKAEHRTCFNDAMLSDLLARCGFTVTAVEQRERLEPEQWVEVRV